MSNDQKEISYDQQQQEQHQQQQDNYDYLYEEQQHSQQQHDDPKDDEEDKAIQDIDTALADHITDDLINGDVNGIAVTDTNQSDGIFLMSRLNGSEEDDTTDESETTSESTSPAHYTTTTTTTTTTVMEMGQSESTVNVDYAWKGDEFAM